MPASFRLLIEGQNALAPMLYFAQVSHDEGQSALLRVIEGAKATLVIRLRSD